MPIIFQKMIYRSDLQANPKIMYIFGDNCVREGHGGQAKEMRGEPNTIGIRTKWKPNNKSDAYWHDSQSIITWPMIDMDFDLVEDYLKDGYIVVWPTDGVGTGLAFLSENAPHTLNYINEKLDRLVKLYGVK